MASKGTDIFGKVDAPADAGAAAVPGQGEAAASQRRDFDPAFALRSTPEHTLEQASELFREENRGLTGKIVAGGVLFAVLFFVSLCIAPSLGAGFMNPADVVDAVFAHIKYPLDALFGNAQNLGYAQLLELHPAYYQVEQRFSVSFVTALCGVMLAVAGSLYQMVFKNPIAAPTMLGVSNGISLGLLVFVLVFQAAALDMEVARVAFSYGGAVIVLLLVLGLTKLICGRGKAFSVFELLLVGTIFSQVAGSIVQVVTDSVMSDELWEIYQMVSEAMNTTIGPFALATLAVVALIALVPVFFMRYAINTIGFSDLEARLIGLDTTKLKVTCLVFGTILVTISQVNLGTVSMISLVVPFISRAVFGTEFKHQFWGDVLFGAIVLLVCRDLVLLLPFYHMELTLGTVVSFVTLPLYVWIIASRQRGWK